MAEDPTPPASGWRAFVGFVQQWQVLLALVVGASGLWFNYNEQRRKELDVNREAVKAAREAAVVQGFLDDPQNTLIEFRATYPSHAFCAALGFFIAENGRAARRGGGLTAQGGKDVSDAIRVQIEALADQANMSEAAFQAFADAAVASAGATPAEARCPRVKAGPPVYARLLVESECLLAIDTYGQNLCNQQRGANAIADAAKTEQVAMGYSSAAWRADPVAIPDPVAPGIDTPTEAVPDPAAIEGPGPACGGVSPLIFPQFKNPADAGRVKLIREGLLGAGWTLAPADNVPDGATLGDLRIYAEAQRPCADAFAAIVSALPEVNRQIRVLSLADRYRSLPDNQMELWLPKLE